MPLFTGALPSLCLIIRGGSYRTRPDADADAARHHGRQHPARRRVRGVVCSRPAVQQHIMVRHPRYGANAQDMGGHSPRSCVCGTSGMSCLGVRITTLFFWCINAQKVLLIGCVHNEMSIFPYTVQAFLVLVCWQGPTRLELCTRMGTRSRDLFLLCKVFFLKHGAFLFCPDTVGATVVSGKQGRRVPSSQGSAVKVCNTSAPHMRLISCYDE